MNSRIIRLAATMLALVPATIFAQSGKIQVRWLGHATFEVVSPGGTRIIIDPFITGNPSTPDSLKSIARWSGVNKPSAILVSHSHSDHAADAKALALATGAPVISTFEYAASLGLPEAQVMGGNVGGSFKIGDVTVNLVPAMHSSDPGGRRLGSFCNSRMDAVCITQAIHGSSATCR